MRRILVMVVVAMMTTVCAWADEVPYIEKLWDGTKVTNDPKIATATKFDNNSSNILGSDGTTTWYYVEGNVTAEDRLYVRGDVRIILCDNATLTAKKGITVADKMKFSIYAQSDDDQQMGALIAEMPEKTVGETAKPGIGSFDECGTITIHGGHITVSGQGNCPGIGSGFEVEEMTSTILIYGGNIEAQGGKNGAGIGAGNDSDMKGTINIYDGTVKATGGYEGAGIGGGWSGDMGGTINIYGGKVIAQGGDYAAGIGGGSGDNDIFFGDDGDMTGTVSIHGGTVSAKGGKKAAGIGGGYDGKGGSVNITAGTVTAQAGDGSNAAGDSDGGSAIGPGCDQANNDASNLGSISIPDYHSVSVGDGVGTTLSEVVTSQRADECHHNNEVSIHTCLHRDGSYIINPEEVAKHIKNCLYCKHSEVQEHYYNENDVCVCGKKKTGYDMRTVSIYEAATDGSGYGKASVYTVVEGQTFYTPPLTCPRSDIQFVGWMPQRLLLILKWLTVRRKMAQPPHSAGTPLRAMVISMPATVMSIRRSGRGMNIRKQLPFISTAVKTRSTSIPSRLIPMKSKGLSPQRSRTAM
jgi:hypothetical protein